MSGSYFMDMSSNLRRLQATDSARFYVLFCSTSSKQPADAECRDEACGNIDKSVRIRDE